MQRSSQHRGFTLVEVLVSVAIALLLIIGVNTVFKATSQTVGAGESLLSAARDSRTVLQTMLADLNYVDAVAQPGSTVGNAPFFVIRSEQCFAFRNINDQQSASNPTDPSQDTNLFSNTAVFPSNRVPVPFLNFRSHRIDRLGFFSRGLFARQTSSNNYQFVSNTAGAEAYIWYGHAQQPNKGLVNPSAGSGGFCDPGDPSPPTGKNDNNYVACDWMLSRMAMVLVPNPNTTTDPNYIVDTGDLSPLSTNAGTATTASTAASGGFPLYTSRLDMAATSITNYTATPLVRPHGIMSYAWGTTPGANYGKDWWTPVIGGTRFQASPFILAGTSLPKITPATLATCAPDLIRGCSSFTVEYAGNFYTKNPNGSAVDTTIQVNGQPVHLPVPDPTGQLDFYIDANGYQHTRWYGFPRSTTGNVGTVSATSGDTVPLRDVLSSLNGAWTTSGTTNYADAERFSTNFPSAGSNYWTSMPGSTMENQAATRYTYTAAWGPDVHNMPFPKMIRIIIEVDDRDNRLKSPQDYEFIYDVQQ